MLQILPNRPGDYPILDPAEAQQIVQAYLALQGDTRRKVRVALQRLNQGQRRHSVGDRALELSTAFETLLGDNGMTHKIKVRSVRLIGGVDDVRTKNAAVITQRCCVGFASWLGTVCGLSTFCPARDPSAALRVADLMAPIEIAEDFTLGDLFRIIDQFEDINPQ